MPAPELRCCVGEQPLSLAHVSHPARYFPSHKEAFVELQRKTSKEASLCSAAAFVSMGTREYLQTREGRVDE